MASSESGAAQLAHRTMASDSGGKTEPLAQVISAPSNFLREIADNLFVFAVRFSRNLQRGLR